MRKYYGITAPVWIFLLTLVLIVLSGRIVGSQSCGRAVENCESSAMQLHPNSPALRQDYVSGCTESACSSGKSGAVVPFSMLALGVVFYVVWLRTGDSSDRDSSAINTASAASGPAPARSSAAPESRQAATAARTTSATSSVPTAEPPPTTTPAAGESTVYLDALQADGEQSKEELAGWLSRLTGISGADRWKGAPAGDLTLLKRAIATAAALGPADSKYRNRVGADTDGSELDALTKKTLHQHCIDVLRADLATLASAATCPGELSDTSVRETLNALDAPQALAGLARLSKSTLVSLAAFLRGPRA